MRYLKMSTNKITDFLIDSPSLVSVPEISEEEKQKAADGLLLADEGDFVKLVFVKRTDDTLRIMNCVAGLMYKSMKYSKPRFDARSRDLFSFFEVHNLSSRKRWGPKNPSIERIVSYEIIDPVELTIKRRFNSSLSVNRNVIKAWKIEQLNEEIRTLFHSGVNCEFIRSYKDTEISNRMIDRMIT